MYFVQPEYFYLLFLLIPLVLLAQWGYRSRRRSQRQFAQVPLLKALKPEASTLRRIVRNGLMLLSIACLVAALARPQLQERKENPGEAKGIEAMIALDISNSMLAEDLSPNRLQFAKLTIHRLLDYLAESKVGVVVFAGNAYMQLPITTDLAMAKKMVDDANPDMLSNQGTAIASAIDLSLGSFSDRHDVGKAIILFTDGENHEGDALEAAKKAKSQGVKVYTIAVGSEEGAPIPQDNGYLMDEEGKMVLSKSNPQMCKEIAQAGDGGMLVGKSVSSLSSKIYDELKKLPQAVVNASTETKHELFGWFVFAALLLLVAMECIQLRKNRFLARLRLFDRT